MDLLSFDLFNSTVCTAEATCQMSE